MSGLLILRLRDARALEIKDRADGARAPPDVYYHGDAPGLPIGVRTGPTVLKARSGFLLQGSVAGATGLAERGGATSDRAEERRKGGRRSGAFTYAPSPRQQAEALVGLRLCRAARAGLTHRSVAHLSCGARARGMRDLSLFARRLRHGAEEEGDAALAAAFGDPAHGEEVCDEEESAHAAVRKAGRGEGGFALGAESDAPHGRGGECTPLREAFVGFVSCGAKCCRFGSILPPPPIG